MTEPIMVLCAWCGVLIRPGKLPASHGCCASCAARLREKIEAES